MTDGGARGPVAVTRRHVAGLHTVDDWGLDEDWIRSPATAGIRWSIHVGGATTFPPTVQRSSSSTIDRSRARSRSR